VGLPLCGGGFHELDARAHGLSQDIRGLLRSKAAPFEGTGAGAPDAAVLNTDDEYGKRLAGLAKNAVSYGLQSGAQLTTKKFQLTFSGLAFTAQTPNGKSKSSRHWLGASTFTTFSPPLERRRHWAYLMM